MARKIVIILLGLAVLVGGYFGFKSLSESRESPNIAPVLKPKGIYAETVTNRAIPVQIISSGQLVATRRVTLTSEVTGVLRSSRFKEGVQYRKGEVIFSIDNTETNANLASQRSNFYTTLLNVMPDLKLDYPEVWAKWDAYLKSINLNKNLPPLPDFQSDREENFITSRGVISSYQLVRNMEIRSGKYTITAPFNGVITVANVQEGGLVTQNQPLGEISSLGDYELELPVNVSYLKYLKVGQDLALTPVEGSGEFHGTVVRVNPRADVGSQTITAYVQIKSDELREGMYLQAVLSAGTIEEAYEIDRKLINSSSEVYIVLNDTILSKTTIEPVYFNDRTAVVKGLENGSVLMSKPLPGAYEGMPVRIIEDLTNNSAEGL